MVNPYENKKNTAKTGTIFVRPKNIAFHPSHLHNKISRWFLGESEVLTTTAFIQQWQ